MKNFIKKFDDFIVNKITLKNITYLILAFILINCYSFFVLKYRINVLDNLLMVFALDFSLLCWFKFMISIKNKEE